MATSITDTGNSPGSNANHNHTGSGSSGSGNANSDTGVPNWTPNDTTGSPNLEFLPAEHPDGTNTTTSVDTASLAAFVTYIDSTLIPGARTVRSSLERVAVQPGAFADADTMRSKINGSGGLSGQYQLVLGSLINGLTSMRDALTTLSHTYGDTEDLNNLSASDLQSDLYSASQYFGAILTDAGGSGGTTPTTGGSNPNTSTGG